MSPSPKTEDLYQIPEATDKEKDQGYQICPKCLINAHTLQAGYECLHIYCEKCDRSVCDKKEFESGSICD